MAKTDNLIDFLEDIADGIREKKGTTDPINAQDFRSEINSIKTDEMRYFDVREVSSVPNTLVYTSFLTKGVHNGNWEIRPEVESTVVAFAIEPNREVYYSGKTDTLWNYINYAIENSGYKLEDFPEITKEEFYDLTWEIPVS